METVAPLRSTSRPSRSKMQETLVDSKAFPFEKALLVTTPELEISHSEWIQDLKTIVSTHGTLTIENVAHVQAIDSDGIFLYDAIILLLPERERKFSRIMIFN